MDHVDTIVVGAGVVGLAIAREIAHRGKEVLILERLSSIGSETSSRNSEVIHAGLYYDHDSMKSRLCVQGKNLLYKYCENKSIDHRRCGKLIVAARYSDVQKLVHIASRGEKSGVHDLKLLDAHEAMTLEPSLYCSAALLSPSSGIIDSHALMTALLGDAEHAGALLVLNTEFSSATRISGRDGWKVCTKGLEDFEIGCNHIVNSAGLYAQKVAQSIKELPASDIPKLTLAKGNYFSLAARSPFSRLIYPLPEEGGLGVHLTLDLAGQAKFGPDVEWLAQNDPEDVDYLVQPARASIFEQSVKAYWPDMPANALQPGYSGVRPKLYGPGEDAADFRIDGPRQHGLEGLVNLFGIESPGLTSCLAIAELVADMAEAGA